MATATAMMLRPHHPHLHAGGIPPVCVASSANHLSRLNKKYGQSKTCEMHCDTSVLPCATSSILKTNRTNCLEKTNPFRTLSVCHGAGRSSEPVVTNNNVSLRTRAVPVGGLTTAADELDQDCPTMGFSSIPEAIEDIRQGKYIIVVDDEHRENEGDLIMAASKVTPEAIAFIVRHSTGIVCVSMKEDDLERLQLPLMVTENENEEKLRAAFTISVDAKEGTTTGVSAKDRTETILALASPNSKPEDFNRPGHIFPLMYRKGGVLRRPGHTEASLDLAVLAGLPPAAVLCEIVDDDDGSMARLPKLQEFARRENLKIITVQDLIRYVRKRE